ncbi:MAG: 50S ribosomal protein L11 methyltransferase [Rhodospirillales bacterium]
MAGPAVDLDAFIVANTEITSPPLVPELRLRLATAVVPLWQATETTLQEDGIEPPYWAFCWPGSQALARLLLDEPGRVRGRRVLDFACGCGIAAIAAARSGACAVVNDIDPLALSAAVLNARLNAVMLAVQPGELTAMPAADDCQVVLAGDVCYEQTMAERCLLWLRRRAAAGDDVLLADPGRAYLPTSGLEAVARYQVPTSRDLEGRDSRECVIWSVLP